MQYNNIFFVVLIYLASREILQKHMTIQLIQIQCLHKI